MIQLPTKIKKATIVEPRLMMIFAHTKCGKTSNLAQLPNSLVIDLEDGADFYDCMSINVKQEAIKQGCSPLKVLLSLPKLIADANTANGGKPVYDFIIIDTTSALETLAESLALIRYKQSPIGKNFTESSVLKLPSGMGYYLLREAFEELYEGFKGLAGKCLILSGHVKSATVNKKGVDLIAKDINLTGKLKQIVCSDVDSIGYMYRDSKNSCNKLSFLTEEQDLCSGSRQDYLSGKEFIISTKKDNKLETNWDLIFPSIKK